MTKKKKQKAKPEAKAGGVAFTAMRIEAEREHKTALAALKCVEKNDALGAIRALAEGQRDNAAKALATLDEVAK